MTTAAENLSNYAAYILKYITIDYGGLTTRRFTSKLALLYQIWCLCYSTTSSELCEDCDAQPR